MLPESTEDKEPSFQSDTRVCLQGESRLHLATGVDLVEEPTRELEREVSVTPEPRCCDRDGRIPSGMGGGVRTDMLRWSMVRRGEKSPHKSFGVDGRKLGGENFHQRQGEHSCEASNGQQNSSVLYQQDGGNSLTQPITSGMPALAMVSPTPNNSLCRVPTRNKQYRGRQAITATPIVGGMDAEQGSFLPCHESSEEMPNRPVCQSAQPSTPQVHQLETGPICNRNGCSQGEMDRSERICISPLCPNSQVSTEGETGGMHSHIGGPDMEHPAMVSSFSRIVCSSPSPVTKEAGPSVRSVQQVSPNPGPSASRLEGVRQQHKSQGISERSTNLIQAGWSKGTNSAYQSAWTRWSSWCGERKINPFSCSVKYFLAELYEEGLQHRTINVIRSAVSMTHDSVEGLPIGQHPMVSRLLKGVYNLRPPKPRYVSTWDVDSVLRHITAMGENDSLKLRDLSRKLALLMAMVEASRSSELQALDLRYRVFSPDAVSFRLRSLTKKRVVGAPPKEVVFGAFPEDSQLCVVKINV